MANDDAPGAVNPNISEVDYDFPDAAPGKSVVITTNRSVFVRILDDENYRLYRDGQDCRAFQGSITTSPYRFRIPRDAHWHVIVDPYTAAGLAEFTVRLMDDTVLSD